MYEYATNNSQTVCGQYMHIKYELKHSIKSFSEINEKNNFSLHTLEYEQN